eukprot:NODE_370_length_8652_cov_0.611715.p2 type:complete len:873 gc:universal NODE_370_length_8652_cov_0.611715:461-3079(+)
MSKKHQENFKNHPSPILEVPSTPKSTAVAGSLSSPHLRTPVRSGNPDRSNVTFADEMSKELDKISYDSDRKSTTSSRLTSSSITLKDIDKDGLKIANELQFASYKVPEIKARLRDREDIARRQKDQFNEKPLLPNQTSQNTIFVKSPRSRASLIRKDTTWDKGFWTHLCRILTCCIPGYLLKRIGGMDKPEVQQAWREKVGLCMLFLCLMGMLAFITFLISFAICPETYGDQIISPEKPNFVIGTNTFLAKGQLYQYDAKRYTGLGLSNIDTNQKDISPKIISDTGASYCSAIGIKDMNVLCNSVKCVNQAELKTTLPIVKKYTWEFLTNSTTLFVYNGYVVDKSAAGLNLDKYFSGLKSKLAKSLGKDVTYAFRQNDDLINAIRCFSEQYRVGYIDTSTTGCFIRDIISNIAMVAILSLIIIRFSLAIGFSWFLSWKLGKWELTRKELFDQHGNKVGSQSSIDSIKKSLAEGAAVDAIQIPPDFRLIYSILMVTCYSEDEAGLKTTLDSLCNIQYPNRYKLIIVVCDGIVKGAGQDKSTPEIVCGLIKEDKSFGTPEPKSYFSIADGKKRHNMARIHCGQYVSELGRKTNIIVIVKCGTPEEATAGKPGNRGKRDSQIVLMDFYRAVMFDAPMSPFQYELFNKVYKLCKVTADKFEIVLMVDADTKVMPDALSHMAAVVAKDPMIMGLCGETRIMNKGESWVSAIQVFEYHVAHHLAKAFESCFGGVTCLPGCFCMYRIKAPRNDGTWAPILASPEIVAQYSENVVNTLHKKNLLLLGEDRFLSTLMLRTFPNRKMMFVPKAVCKTCVPNSFQVLLSQRRRWINSTIHNLFELLLVQELCGTFCFSMQFVVFLELIGTLTLPAAIVFTTYF